MLINIPINALTVSPSVPIAKHPLAMAAAPLVVGLGVWAAAVMGVALLFQEYRLKQKAGAPQEEAFIPREAAAVGLDAQNSRRAFRSPALLVGGGPAPDQSPAPEET